MDIIEIQHLLKSLTNTERNDLVRRFKQFDNRDNTSLNLISTLLKKTISYEETQLILYGKQNEAALDKLLNRLVDRICDIWLTRENIESNIIFDLRAKDIFFLKRELLLAELFRFRGYKDIALNKIKKIIHKSELYEHFDTLLLALNLKRRWDFFYMSAAELKNLDNYIGEIEQKSKYYKESFDIYVNLGRDNNNQSVAQYSKYLKESLKKVNNCFKLTASKSIKIICFALELELHSVQKKYNDALRVLNEHKQYLHSDEIVYSKNRYGNLLINISIINRYLYQFDTSIKHLNEARKHYVDEPQIELLIYEHYYLTYFYSGNMSMMNYYLNLIKENLKESNLRYQANDRLKYIFAVFYFIRKMFKECAHEIRTISSAVIDPNINTEVKLLSIYLSIEMGKFDLADNMINSLKKYVSRLTSNGEYEMKFTIIDILVSLSRNSYNFKLTKDKCSSGFLSLEQFYKRFNQKEFHLINFYEWYECKIQGRSYNHVNAMSEIQKNNKK
jgi:hypothetical protein